MNLDQWLADVNGRAIGAGQCWDLAQDYAARVCGAGTLSTQVGPHPGYASNVWAGFGGNGVEQWFGQAPANATALPGWIAVWDWGSPVAPFSHIAPVVKDYGAAAYCMSQNPGPAHYMPIPKLKLLGYLVPHTMGGGAGVQLAGDTSSSSGTGSDPFTQISGFVDAVTNVQRFFATPKIWNRIGLYLLAAFILLAAVIYIFKDQAENLAEKVMS